MVTTLARGGLVALIALAAGCLGRVEVAGSNRTLPFHAHEDALAAYPRADVAAPTPIAATARLRFAPFVAYYPLPVGLAIKPAAFNSATSWAPIEIAPEPAEALRRWFATTVTSGDGDERVVEAVVTDFEWYMLGFSANAGRIATQVVVTDAAGAIVYRGAHVTRARVPFVDALFRVHVRAWLEDPAFVAALNGGAR